MTENLAFVRLGPVNGSSASLELHLQTNVLALSRRWLVGILDIQVSIGLIVFSGWDVAAGWLYR